ncbi:MAG: diguanylate cyclase [Candidatus Omnitrophica bacterium]|nr:diguanylate cyclase [Candidatus Omnitrophota bacterium]
MIRIADMDTIKKLQEETEKLRSQFYIFYELTKAMRSTLRLDEIVYIILTGLTARQGLAFNRAILFLVDDTNQTIQGYMGIGPVDGQEANQIWKSIEHQKMDLRSLTFAYHCLREGKKTRFSEYVESMSFPLSPASGIIYSALFDKGPVCFSADHDLRYREDPLVKHLKLKDFLTSSLWIKDEPRGLILVDNYITKKPISEDDTRIFNMFVEQAQGAIENSKVYEDTLLRAHTDSLTGLWNHGYFQYALDEEMTKAKRAKTPLSIMMIDMDNFKRYNDVQGHIQGDKALKRVSAILKDNCRKVDTLCRYGGEEFSLILPATSLQEAYLLAERIRTSVAHSDVLGSKFTISIGIAALEDFSLEKETFIRRADTALYRAKREGKNQVVPA